MVLLRAEQYETVSYKDDSTMPMHSMTIKKETPVKYVIALR